MTDFAKGSLVHLQLLSKDYEDIIDVQESLEPCKITVLCKPNYNIDNVLEFLENLQLAVDFEVKVQTEVNNNLIEDYKECSDCGEFKTDYEEVYMFGNYETVAKDYCNSGHDLYDTDPNKCKDYWDGGE